MGATLRLAMLRIALLLVAGFTYTQSLSENSTTTLSPTEKTGTEDVFSGKDDSLKECPTFELDPEEYVLYPNGTAFVKDYNRTYTEPFYVLQGEWLMVCMPSTDMEENVHQPNTLASNSMNLLATIGIGVSMVCLLIHLVVFVLVPDLQNLPGFNLASLCVSLFISYLMMIAAGTDEVFENRTACVVVAGMMQFFFLASFMWMSVMAFDVFRSILQATGSLRTSSRGFKAKKYLVSSLVVWGTSAAFTTAAMVADNVDWLHEDYRPQFAEFCWFQKRQSLLAFFAGPVFALICVNFVLFGVSAWKIFTNQMKSSQDSQRSNLRRSHLMYFRLAVIVGVTWITGALAAPLNVLWLWYLFAALNAFQGLFIFLAFTFTSKVKKHFRIKLLGERESSGQKTPTFQSYCYYANSIEKDLDKVVDSKDKNEVIDTVIIHI